MNPTLLFWIPAILRVLAVLAAAAGVGYVWGLVAGLAAGLAAMTMFVVLQLHYLHRLGNWLENPESEKIPDGWDAWSDVFARLYRLRRNDENNRVELAEWLTRFRQAMSLLPDGVVIMDDVLFLEWCNPVAERHLGLELERDKGMRVTNLVRHPDFMDYIILGRYDQPLMLHFRQRQLIMHIIPFESRRQILVTHDATESERIDMMRRDFVANASHELRTPLTVINGFLEIASSRTDLDPVTRAEHVRLMTEQGRRMQNLVEDMLILTRLESSDYPLRAEPIDIEALIGQIFLEGKALSAGRHRLSMTVEGPNIMGNPEELRSAFGNLVSNAVRYTPEGGSIDLSWSLAESGPRFAVRDTGIGISPEHIPRLTERFYRVDKSRSRDTQGTGLGLAIVKHVLMRHDASIAIDSAPGKGSAFTIAFRMDSVRDGAVDRPAEPNA